MSDWISLYAWLHLGGRMLFALPFLVDGLDQIRNMNAIVARAESRGQRRSRIALAASGTLMLAGGLSLVLGWHRFIGAGLLALVLVPTAFTVNPYWKEKDPGARAALITLFLKDLGFAGAALFIAYYAGANWPLSVGH